MIFKKKNTYSTKVNTLSHIIMHKINTLLNSVRLYLCKFIKSKLMCSYFFIYFSTEVVWFISLGQMIIVLSSFDYQQ